MYYNNNRAPINVKNGLLFNGKKTSIALIQTVIAYTAYNSQASLPKTYSRKALGTIHNSTGGSWRIDDLPAMFATCVILNSEPVVHQTLSLQVR